MNPRSHRLSAWLGCAVTTLCLSIGLGPAAHAQTFVRNKAGDIVLPNTQILRPTAGNAALPPPGSVTIVDHAYFSNADRLLSTTVYVCWEDPAESKASDRKIVEDAIAGSWQRYSKLHFAGWQSQCQPTSAAIHIRVADDGPHTAQLGRLLLGIKDGMVLNFTFANWGPACAAKRESCIKSIAVHEFGHAIGFAHEQNRPDTPGECMQAPQGTNGDTLLTPWDPHSVMNYCNSVYNNDGTLSQWDIDGVRLAYGK